MAKIARITTRVTAVAALVASALVPVGAASAVSSSSTSSSDLAAALNLLPGFAGVADSFRLDAPAMLHGRLTGPGGEPLSGAAAFLSAWPSNEAIKALPIGGTFELTPIARMTTARDGSYEFRSALTPALAPLVGKDGLDVQLDVFHGGRQYTWMSQLRTNGVGWVLPSITDSVQTVTARASNALNALDVTFAASQGAPTAQFLPTHHDPDAEKRRGEKGPHPFPGVWCVNRKIAEKKAPTRIATTFARQGTISEVVYGSGAQSKLSTGLSINAGGTFAISGERTRTADFGGGFAPQHGRKGAPAHTDFLINYVHAVVAQECLGNTERDIRVRRVSTSPIEPSGGGWPVPSEQPKWKCLAENIEPATFRWVSTEKSQAYTFTKGFSFSPYGRGVFTGESTSGYSDTVKVQYYFKHPERGGWCGHTAYPNAKGQMTQAFEKRPNR